MALLKSISEAGEWIAEQITFVDFAQMLELPVRQIGVIKLCRVLRDFFFTRPPVSVIQRFFSSSVTGAVLNEGWIEWHKGHRDFNDVSLTLFPHARVEAPLPFIVQHLLLAGTLMLHIIQSPAKVHRGPAPGIQADASFQQEREDEARNVTNNFNASLYHQPKWFYRIFSGVLRCLGKFLFAAAGETE